MKPEEAIEIIKQNFPKTCRMVNGRYQGGFDDTECDFGKALLMAIEAIKEMQKYKLIENATIGEIAEVLREFSKIGTVEECRKAVEKQEPKRPIDADEDYGFFICPVCRKTIYASDDFESHKFCLNCGQAIQWDAENLEEMEE